MTTKQADRLIGKEIKVRWPRYNEAGTIVIVSRDRNIVTAQDKAYGGREGKYEISEMELAN